MVAAALGALARWRAGGGEEVNAVATSTSDPTTATAPATATSAGVPAARTTTELPPTTTSEDPTVLVTVIGRQGWGALPAGDGLEPHTIERVTVHHTAALLEDNADAPGQIRGHQRFHLDTRGWPDLAYHFIIDAAGYVYEGRDPAMAGDTATDYDPAGHLLVCCEGNFDRQPLPEPQRAALETMLAWGVSTYGVGVDTITGHGDHAATSCPGAAIRDLLRDGTLREAVTARLEQGAYALDIVTGVEATAAVSAIESG